MSAEDFIDGMIGRVDSQLLTTLETRVANLSGAEILTRYSDASPGDIAPAMLATYMGLSSPCGPGSKPAAAISPSKEVGQAVHLRIQEHYLWSHPHHAVLTESRIYFPGGGNDTVRQLSQGKSGPGHSIEAALIDYTLTMTSRLSRKRPDILNLTTREVYEIKPRKRVYLGMAQLNLIYLLALNATLDIIVPKNPTFDATTFKPGLCREWMPMTIYPIPPDKVALTCVDPFTIPGLIVYDLFKVRRLPALQPVPVEVPVARPASTLLLAAALLLLIALALTPIPGDELAAIPLLAPAL